MKRLYHKVPHQISAIPLFIVASYKKFQKYGAFFHKHFRFLVNSTAKEQEIKAEEELSTFLEQVQINSDFYKQYDKNELNSFPILDKQEVVDNYDLIAQEPAFKIVKSSGTTGKPLAVPYTKSAYQKEYAFWWYHRSFCEVKRGNRIVTFAGHQIRDVNADKKPFWGMNHAENQLIFSSYHLSKKNIPFYIKRLNQFKPTFIHGYPSSIYLISKHLVENNIRLEFIPKMIATASETLLDFQRVTIEEAFLCKVYLWYGNTEFCGHITECPNGNLHVQPYHSKVRILDNNNRDVEPGGEGRIVATNFSNFSFPLINYDTKDVVRLSENQECHCGKGSTIIDYIIGRVEDYIITPTGRFVGRLDHLFKDAKFIKNAQLEQNQLDTLLIKIEKNDSYNSEIEKIILKEAYSRLGKEMKIEFQYPTEIPKQSNGKYKFIIQNYKHKLNPKPKSNETSNSKF